MSAIDTFFALTNEPAAGDNLILSSGLNVFALIFIGTWIAIYQLRKAYKNFVFRPFKTKRTRFKVSVMIAVQMLIRDRDDLREKRIYMTKYFLRKEKSSLSGREIVQTIRYYISKGIDTRGVLRFVRKRFTQDEKTQFIDLLVDLGYYNQQVNSSEMEYLFRVARKISFSEEELKVIIGVRERYYNKTRRQMQKEEGQSEVEKNLLVLGLDTAVDFEEIKQAYRKMVRRFHPDRFVRMSKEEQEMAHERFTEINLAYEYLERRFN